MEIYFRYGKPECLYHLDDDEIEAMIADYQNTHIQVADICTRYNITLIEPKELRLYLPYIVSDRKCPYCGVPMYTNVIRQLPTRHLNKGNKKRLLYTFCESCGHGSKQNIDRINGSCNCKNCFKKAKPAYTYINLYK